MGLQLSQLRTGRAPAGIADFYTPLTPLTKGHFSQLQFLNRTHPKPCLGMIHDDEYKKKYTKYPLVICFGYP